MGSIPVGGANKKVPFVFQTKGTFLSDAFLSDRDVHDLRDVDIRSVIHACGAWAERIAT